MEIVKIYTVKQHGIHPLKQTRHMDIPFQAHPSRPRHARLVY
jgi:hypothetical protein